LPALAELSDTKRSRYTSLDPTSCQIVGTAPAARPSRRCEGVAGYALEAADIGAERHLAIVTPNGDRSELDLPYIADRSFGKVAEWRAQDSTSAPRALIVRVSSSR